MRGNRNRHILVVLSPPWALDDELPPT